MKNLIISIFIILVLSACRNSKREDKPNIIFFLADDLGYGESGIYGQRKIQTPNINALAESGMRFTQFYSGSPVCAPSRCVFLTGNHTGHTFIRGNDEWAERGEVWNYTKAVSDFNLEGQRPIPDSTITLAELLKTAGYKTGIVGKWGLGAPQTEGTPNHQGFDYFYGYNCQRQAHNLYPPHLWENDKKIPLNNEIIPPGTKLDSLSDPYDLSSYQKYFQNDYAPAKIQEKALEFIRTNKDSPFFMYYASPLPHLPLQVPQEFIDQYREQFGEEKPYLGEKGYFPNRYPRAAYAAMISYLDKQLGELIALLKELGVYENTIIMFSSDNGPTYAGGVDFDFFESSKPFSNGYGRTKGFLYEGGIRVPFIASWEGHIKEGSQSDHISAFYDLLPTICDFAQIVPPENIDGISFKPSLLNQKQKEHAYLYWEIPEYNGQQAVRMGKWKGIRKNILKGNLEVELYDLENDSVELNNIADQYPEIVQNMEDIMTKEHEVPTVKKFKLHY